MMLLSGLMETLMKGIMLMTWLMAMVNSSPVKLSALQKENGYRESFDYSHKKLKYCDFTLISHR